MRNSKNMKWAIHTGFTIIEVILVLAVTSAILVGLIAMQGNNLARRRYNDAVNNFQAFMQSQYDFSTNIQNWRDGKLPVGECGGGPGDGYLGRSNCAIYGVMIEFGRGTPCSSANRTGACYTRYSWVVGRDYDRDTLFQEGNDGLFSVTDYTALANAGLRRVRPWQDYQIEWGGQIQAPIINGLLGTIPGAVLILRMPITGTIMTFIYNDDITVSPINMVSTFNLTPPTDGNAAAVVGDAISGQGIGRMVELVRKDIEDLNNPLLDTSDDIRRFAFLCIESPDSGLIGGAGSKRILAIAQGGSNASAMQLLEQDAQLDITGRREVDGGRFDVRCP